MSISFKNLADPKLELLDVLTFGKLRDCRICDVIADHYEYLIWAEKSGFVKFQYEVVEKIHSAANFETLESNALCAQNPWFIPDLDDVPF